jgi:hypothetical protein
MRIGGEGARRGPSAASRRVSPASASAALRPHSVIRALVPEEQRTTTTRCILPDSRLLRCQCSLVKACYLRDWRLVPSLPSLESVHHVLHLAQCSQFNTASTAKYQHSEQNNMGADLYKLTATEVLTKIRADEVSVEAYASSLLRRIEARDNAVQAWAYLDPAYVIEQARALDAIPKSERGPLHGVAIAVKDVIFTRGQSTYKNGNWPN